MAPSLSGELSFANALTLLEQAGGEDAAAAALDLSAVTRADSAGLALLLELTRRARSGGATLKIENAPPQLRKLAEFFGLDELLSFS